jgi:hypothetical protein
MFIVQPTLSQQIRRLEEIVGTPLLQRRREGLRLTPAGRAVLAGKRPCRPMHRPRPRAAADRDAQCILVPGLGTP